MRTRLLLSLRLLQLLIVLGLPGCSVLGPPQSRPSRGAAAPAPRAAPAGPATSTSATPGQPLPGPSAAGTAGTPRQFTLGPAASALVTQARREAGGGDYDQAAATLERALRIEPDNPLLWIELGRTRLSENNAAQADAMGRKALTLAGGDPAAQSAAWRLIGASLRARGRAGEAYDADRRAEQLVVR